MKRIYNFSDISSGLLRIMMIPALLLGAAAVRAGTLTHEVQIDLSEIRGTLKEYAGEEFMVFEPKTLDLTSEEGKPMLPVKYIRLAVPTYASNFRVSTQSQPFTQYTMPHRIFPAQMPILTNENKTDSFLPPDSTYYNTNSWSPVAEYKGTGYLEGEQQIVTVAVYPISYNPVSSESRIYSTVTLNLEYDIVTADDLPLKPIITNACGYASYIRNIVDNPVEADNIYLPPNTPSDPSLPFLSIKNYYIITSRNLVESFAELAAWKSQKGYNVKLIAIEDIINGPLNVGYDPNSALQDDASLLRKYLRTEYENNGIYFLFLGGDESNMPVFRVKTTKPKSPPQRFPTSIICG